MRVGVITNDQGTGLVDTASSFQISGFRFQEGEQAAVREVTGGCFCCKADELVGVLREMEAAIQPEVFLAEPVGSCTDLVATVLLPLEKAYGKKFRRAPMSVVVDARRAWGHYFSKGKAAGRTLDKDVAYIYLKQLEEAEIIVINKVDVLKAGQAAKLVERLGRDWPGKQILTISARSGAGCEHWLDLLLGTETAPTKIMKVDYERYAVGEALLGWYNATLQLHIKAAAGCDGNQLILRLARSIQAELEGAGAVLAHFKMGLNRDAGILPAIQNAPAGNPTSKAKGSTSAHRQDARAPLAVVNAVQNGVRAELSRQMEEPFHEGTLLINLRAEADPKLLASVVARHIVALSKKLTITWIEQAAFRPGKPTPTYRVTKVPVAEARPPITGAPPLRPVRGNAPKPVRKRSK